MKKLAFLLASTLLWAGCTKNKSPRVDIFLLQSYNKQTDTSLRLPVTTITNARLLNAPFVRDEDIVAYLSQKATFRLRKNIQSTIEHFGPDKAFAVAINGKPVYYGLFHPAFMSSIRFGVATIIPGMEEPNELTIHFASMDNVPELKKLDKRNDTGIIEVLKKTGRLQ